MNRWLTKHRDYSLASSAGTGSGDFKQHFPAPALHNRILLAGDAAHLFPATGAALNVGMLDTVNLAWKLAADIHGWTPAGLLDTYHDERHFAGTRALLQTRAQAALARGHDPDAEALREIFRELLVDEQPLHRIGALVAATDIRYQLPAPTNTL